MKILILLLLIGLVASTATINCNFEKLSSSYSCNPLSVNGNLNEQNQEIAINGTHVNNFKDDDVNYVRFNSPLNFNFVPTKLFEIFPNIETFGLHSVNLTTISSNAFTDCFKLKSLHIDGNENLIELSSSFAAECSNLKNIYMSSNGLKIIDEDAFKGLDNLNYLVLTRNHLEILLPTIFIHTPNLQFLFLDHNQLVKIHADLFYPLRQLQILSLTFNHIKIISLEIFRNNPLLDQIFLDDNQIIAIEPSFFDEFPGKREFYEYRFYKNNCTNSAIISSKIPEDDKSYNEENFTFCFEKWHDLQRLELKASTSEIDQLLDVSIDMDIEESTIISYQHNCRYFLNENRKYTCVLENVDLVLSSVGGEHYENFTDLNVTHLFFFNSILSKVPAEIFVKFHNLEFLSVANTQMTLINDITFGNCGKLKKIDASENQITKIIDSSFKNCLDLEIIDLSGNPIEALNGEIFHYDPQLKHIVLHKNF